jgi:hypothetical protein
MSRDHESVEVDELKIDKDCMAGKYWIAFYVQTILQTCREYGVGVWWIKMCNSKRKGQHFYIKLKQAVDSEFANMLQWLLGDDCRPVNFNNARIESGLVEWNKLFEVPCSRLRTLYEAT